MDGKSNVARLQRLFSSINVENQCGTEAACADIIARLDQRDELLAAAKRGLNNIVSTESEIGAKFDDSGDVLRAAISRAESTP